MPLPMGAPPLGSRLPPATLGVMQGTATPQRSKASAGTSDSKLTTSFAPPSSLPPRPRSDNEARRQTHNRQGLDLKAVSANVHKARSAGVEPAQRSFYKRLGGLVVGTVVMVATVVATVATGGVAMALVAGFSGLYLAKAAGDAYLAKLMVENAKAEARGEIPPHTLPMGADSLAHLTYKALVRRDESQGKKLAERLSGLEQEVRSRQVQLDALGDPQAGAALQQRADLAAEIKGLQHDIEQLQAQQRALFNSMTEKESSRRKAATLTSFVVGTGLITASSVATLNPFAIGAGLINASLWTGLFVYDKKTEGLMQLGLADADGKTLDRYIDLTLQAQSLAQQPMPASDEEAAKIQEQLARLERDIEQEVSSVAARVEDKTIHAGRNLNAVGVAGHFFVDVVEGAGDITDQTVIGPLIAGAQVLAQAIKRQDVVDDRKQRDEQSQSMREELRDIQSRIDAPPPAVAKVELSVTEMNNALRV